MKILIFSYEIIISLTGFTETLSVGNFNKSLNKCCQRLYNIIYNQLVMLMAYDLLYELH